MATWRKGLRWDKLKSAWVNVKSGKKLSPASLKRRKGITKKAASGKAKRPKRPKGWRKGLSWNKEMGGWTAKVKRVHRQTGRVIETRRLLTEKDLGFRIRYLEMQSALKRVSDEKAAVQENMRQVLMAAVISLESMGYVTDYRVHANKDGSIDSELRVKPKRGQSVTDIFIDMESVLAPLPSTFVTTGVRYYPKDDEETDKYTKFQGMLQAQAYYQKMSWDLLPYNFASGKEIDTRMRARGRRKAEQVFVRINWNPKHERPETPLQRERQKPRK